MILYTIDMRAKVELADIIQKFGKQLIAQDALSPQQTKALINIVQCRTASLGGHQEACDCCAAIRYSYNSCGDRHCPKCLAAKQAVWIDKLLSSTLPIKHFHIVFTVPHCLNKLALWNDDLFYKLLFAAVWNTLRSFGYSHYGCESGAIAVLHTWGQNLSLHPHVHCIVPAAGYSIKGNWKTMGKSGKYLYPVHQLSATFKGKMLDSIKRALKKKDALAQFNPQIEQAYKKPWVVFSEASLAKAEHVIQYLGQYTHRVAITNQRILGVSGNQVTFIAKDYRDKAKKSPVKLHGVEFLRRFCMHVLPKRFVKIRRYGIYHHTTKRNLKLKFTNQTIEHIEKKVRSKETAQQALKRLTGFDAYKCPHCKKGTMRVIRELPRIRSPSNHLPTLLNKILQ